MLKNSQSRITLHTVVSSPPPSRPRCLLLLLILRSSIMSLSYTPSLKPSPVFPAYHPQLSSSLVGREWIRAIEQSAEWKEVENRPWANLQHRTDNGCIGNDFVWTNPAVHLRFFWNDATKSLCGAVHFDIDAEGPAKLAHGASIALVFDEILAYPVWHAGFAAFTANLNLNLRKTVPLCSVMRFDSKVDKVDGRKIQVVANITNPITKDVHADCKGLWIASKYMGSTQAQGIVQPTTLQSKL